ncbi:MprA protease, GlyGly-CTERM protein-sorting domain-containing form [Phycisphaeraceae bacterium D3-23]
MIPVKKTMFPLAPGRAGDMMRGLSVLAVTFLITTPVMAGDIFLANHSFEDPPIVEPQPGDPNFGDPFATTTNEFEEGWVTTGPVYNRFGVEGQNDTGRFLNRETVFPNPGGGDPIVIPALPAEMVDGEHIGFLVVNPNANGTLATDVASIAQMSGADFETQTDYSFTLSVGSGALFAAGEGSTVVLEIGYFTDEGFDLDTFDPGIHQFVGLAETEVLQADVLSTFPLLSDYTVELLADDVTADVLGRRVSVRVMQVGGEDGTYNVDNARLSSQAVPEPATATLLLAAGALFVRRRRARA